MKKTRMSTLQGSISLCRCCIPCGITLINHGLKVTNGQFFSVATGMEGPVFLFFYPARFWIDRKLKKSMGH